jgi:hypothetical protein
VYTIWRQQEFIYVGMSGRGAKAEDFVAARGQEGQAKGLWTRLGSNASVPAACATCLLPGRRLYHLVRE